jgi:hypothetical protein
MAKKVIELFVRSILMTRSNILGLKILLTQLGFFIQADLPKENIDCCFLRTSKKNRKRLE